MVDLTGISDLLALSSSKYVMLASIGISKGFVNERYIHAKTQKVKEEGRPTF